MQGNQAKALEVFNEAKRVAKVVRLEDILRPAEAEFNVGVGDTAKSQVLPSVVAPPAAKTDSASKPGAKKP
jgi:hypothetical protein